MPWIRVESIISVTTCAPRPRYSIHLVPRGSWILEVLRQGQELTTRSMTCQMKESMFCPKINLQENGNSWTEGDNPSLNLKPDGHKVHLSINKAPGPGTYRLPSDFGQYDDMTQQMNLSTTEFVKTGRSTTTSNMKREWVSLTKRWENYSISA